MSGQLLEAVAKRVLRDTAKKNINSKDPYYEEVPVYSRQGRPTGRVKKQKKGIPGILSQNDGKVLKRVRRRAFHLDMSLFNCCGIRFGWSSVIGIIPVLGDAIDFLLAWRVVKACGRIDGGLPPSLQYRMYFNILLDFGIGLVPFVGDVADAIFRANTRNAWLLEEYLIQKAEAEQRVREEKERRGQPAPGQQRPCPPDRQLEARGDEPRPKKSTWSSWLHGQGGQDDPSQNPQAGSVDVEQGNQRPRQQHGQHSDPAYAGMI